MHGTIHAYTCTACIMHICTQESFQNDTIQADMHMLFYSKVCLAIHISCISFRSFCRQLDKTVVNIIPHVGGRGAEEEEWEGRGYGNNLSLSAKTLELFSLESDLYMFRCSHRARVILYSGMLTENELN